MHHGCGMDTLFELLGCTTGEPRNPLHAWPVIGINDQTGYAHYVHWPLNSGDYLVDVSNNYAVYEAYGYPV